MSTLEKFGILVILILVVIIGVVAVWGVGGEGTNPFAGEEGEGDDLATMPLDGLPGAPGPAGTTPDWPGAGTATAVDAGTGPVSPPPVAARPEPPPVPPAGAMRTYTVRKGDTLARIAEATLGSSGRWKDILAVNPGTDPRKLKIGDVLNIPVPAGGSVAGTTPGVPAPNSLRAAGTEAVPERSGGFKPNDADGPTDPADPGTGVREVQVQKGDTFYSLATRYLGNSNYHYKIQAANPDVDPRKLKPGMKIKIPAR